MFFRSPMIIFRNSIQLLVLGLLLTAISACNNDSTPNTAIDEIALSIPLSSAERIPPVDSNGTGSATLTVNKATGDISGSFTTSALSSAVTKAHIHTGVAGMDGGSIITYEQSNDPNTWNIPAGSTLDTEQLATLLSGGTYINVHTTNHPSGEIRGQVALMGIEVILTNLEGSQEVPSVTTTGSATVYSTVNKATGEITAILRTTGLDDTTKAHIHSGIAGTNGSSIIGFVQDATDLALWSFPEGSMLTSEQLAEYSAGGTYFNVHTPANPSGEVRGQIAPQDISVLLTSLEGQQEVPTVTTAGSATVYSTVNITTGAISAILHTTGLDDTTKAHIHSGIAGTNGSSIIGFVQDATDIALWSFPEGSMLTSEQLTQYSAGGTYFNVHTPANPSGEVRGQIAPQDISVLLTSLDGLQEVPPVTTSGSATVYSTVNQSTGAISAILRTRDLDDTTKAHIHSGIAGTNGSSIIGFVQDATDLALWSFPEGAMLTSEQLAEYSAGGTYFNVHTPANPSGEVRGQALLK